MRSWLIMGALVFVAGVSGGGLGLSACADGAYLEGGPSEDQPDLGRPDLGPPPPDLGPVDSGPPDLGPPDLGPPDMGPDLGPCNGQPTCCGDGIVQSNEECEAGLPMGNPDRCPVNPASDCDQSGSTDMCIEGNNCQRHCVLKDPLRASIQMCP